MSEQDMPLALTQDQTMLGDSVERFLADHVGINDLRKLVEDPELSKPLWAGLAALGLPGLMAPEKHGGSGLALADMVVVAEKCGAAALPAPLLSHVCAVLALGEAGEKNFLPKLVSGERIATLGFAGAGATTASWVERADAADVAVILGDKGLYVLDGAKELASENSADLTRPCFSVKLDKALWLPLADKVCARIRSAHALLLAADAWGIGQRFLTSARDYAVTRETFGRKIGEYQSIKHPLADMVIMLSFSQMLARRAAQAWDIQAADAPELTRLAKAHITQEVLSMARQCVEMMGAYGFTWEGGDHIWLKRAMFDSLQGGSPMSLRREIAALRGWNDPTQDRTLTRMWRRKL